MTPTVRAVRATTPRMSPAGSRAAVSGSDDSGTVAVAEAKITVPTTTLNQNTARQPATPTRVPPMTGPRAIANPDTAAHAPRAWARTRSSGNRCRITDSVPGSEAAAPRPITTRPAMSQGTEGATAPKTEPAQ